MINIEKFGQGATNYCGFAASFCLLFKSGVTLSNASDILKKHKAEWKDVTDTRDPTTVLTGDALKSALESALKSALEAVEKKALEAAETKGTASFDAACSVANTAYDTAKATEAKYLRDPCILSQLITVFLGNSWKEHIPNEVKKSGVKATSVGSKVSYNSSGTECTINTLSSDSDWLDLKYKAEKAELDLHTAIATATAIATEEKKNIRDSMLKALRGKRNNALTAYKDSSTTDSQKEWLKYNHILNRMHTTACGKNFHSTFTPAHLFKTQNTAWAMNAGSIVAILDWSGVSMNNIKHKHNPTEGEIVDAITSAKERIIIAGVKGKTVFFPSLDGSERPAHWLNIREEDSAGTTTPKNYIAFSYGKDWRSDTPKDAIKAFALDNKKWADEDITDIIYVT